MGSAEFSPPVELKHGCSSETENRPVSNPGIEKHAKHDFFLKKEISSK